MYIQKLLKPGYRNITFDNYDAFGNGSASENIRMLKKIVESLQTVLSTPISRLNPPPLTTKTCSSPFQSEV